MTNHPNRKKNFYATIDSDENGYVLEDAHIIKFSSFEEVEEFFSHCYQSFEDEWAVKIVPGIFADCWKKAPCLQMIGIGSAFLRPFSYRQLSILEPGQHPGCHGWWVTPKPDVYVPLLKKRT